MNIVAVVQARLASTRLPAKILLDLGGKTALERCLRRVERIRGVQRVVVATSTEAQDDVVALVAKRLGYQVSRGSEHDVLDRYVKAAHEARAEAVVRCTSDCPLLDPEMATPIVDAFLARAAANEPVDYAANNMDRRLPRGLDAEIASMVALERAHREATDPSEREHVTLRLYRNPQLYRCLSVVPVKDRDLSSHRWTLDTIEDYHFLARVFAELGDRASNACMQDVLDVLSAAPALLTINSHVEQKPT